MELELCPERESLTDPVADGILRRALHKGGAALHRAVRDVSRLHPEWRLQIIWNRVRYLRRQGNGAHRGRYTWTPELEEVLRVGYQQGYCGAKVAINRVLEVRPSWSRTAVWARAHRMGITNGREPVPRPWTEHEERYVLMHATVTPIPVIAKRLMRTETSVRAKIRDMGYSTRYEGGYTASRIASLLRVSRHTVRGWLQKGWLGKNWGRRISEASFRSFLKKHADKVQFDDLTPEVRNWLVEEMEFDPDGTRTSQQQGRERQPCGGSRPAARHHSSKDG